MKTEEAVTLVHADISGGTPRVELRNLLNLTGCEVSLNTMEAGTAVPFVHTHKENEEIYLILSGKGDFWLDGTVQPLAAGDALRIAPAVKRCLRSSAEGPLTYICVQAKSEATPNFTMTDGVIVPAEVSWS